MLKKGDKKLINGWAFYDWANSVYSLVIGTAVFPIFYESVTESDGGIVQFLGTDWHNTTIYSYALGFSFLIVALMSPILSAIAVVAGFLVDPKVWLMAAAIYVAFILYFMFYSRHHLVTGTPEEEFANIKSAEEDLR